MPAHQGTLARARLSSSRRLERQRRPTWRGGSALVGALLTLLPAAVLPLPVHAGDWRPGIPRTAYVNLFEWSWDSVARECTHFLGPKGYAAVQVSPPNEHKVAPEWWSRYQPVSYQLSSRSGNREQFAAMVRTCRQAGVDVYVDTVINHMANGQGTGTAGSRFDGDALTFPGVPWTSADFHSPCVSNYSQRDTVTQCWMGRSGRDVGLPDLDTGRDRVQDLIAGYLNDLRRLGVAGFRIDAAKHMRPAELQSILGRVSSPYFITQEILKDGSYAADIEAYFRIGTVNEMTFGYAMLNAFLNREGFSLRTLPEQFRTWGFFPSDRATVFVANHDTERTGCSTWGPGGVCEQLNTYRPNEMFLANIFMLAYDYGYPQVMSGYYFNNHDVGPQGQPYQGNERTPSNCSSTFQMGKWDCVHRDPRVANMVGFRNYTAGMPVDNWVNEGDNRISFRRGNKGFVAINNTADHWQQTFVTSLPDNTYCNVVAAPNPEEASCPVAAQYRVSGGRVTANIPPHAALALHIGALATARPQNPEDFADVTSAAANAVVTSDTITLDDVGRNVGISVNNGEYRINGGSWTRTPGRVSDDQTVQLRTRSSSTAGQSRTVVLTVGDHAIDWVVTTRSGDTCSGGSFCPTGTVDSNPGRSALRAGQPVTLYYKGSLANSSTVKLHWGTNGWTGVTDTTMTRGTNGYWQATITLPAATRELDFAFTDGVNWDNNGRADWKWPVTCDSGCTTDRTVTFKVRAETIWGESVYVTGNTQELGNWSTTMDDRRRCDPASYPVWTCTIRMGSSQGQVEYKYQKLGLGTKWETGANRVLPASSTLQEDGTFRR